MKHSHFVAVVTVLLALAACSSTPRTAENSEDKVIARIDGMSSRPGWLKESEAFKIVNGNVTALGSTEIPSDNRVSAAYRIAENNAKQSLCSTIEQRLEFILQNAEEGTAADSTQVRYIGSEACQLTTSSIRPDKRYWERVATTRDSGERVTETKVFATVTMPEADFKRAILDAIRKRQGKGGISADFAKKVDAQWDRFVGATRETASEQ
jgi:hypothetical protein